MFHFQPLLNVSWDLTREEMETDTLREVHLICDILKHSPVYPELSSIYTSYTVVAAWAFAKKNARSPSSFVLRNEWGLRWETSKNFVMAFSLRHWVLMLRQGMSRFQRTSGSKKIPDVWIQLLQNIPQWQLPVGFQSVNRRHAVLISLALVSDWDG